MNLRLTSAGSLQCSADLYQSGLRCMPLLSRLDQCPPARACQERAAPTAAAAVPAAPAVCARTPPCRRPPELRRCTASRVRVSCACNFSATGAPSCMPLHSADPQSCHALVVAVTGAGPHVASPGAACSIWRLPADRCLHGVLVVVGQANTVFIQFCAVLAGRCRLGMSATNNVLQATLLPPTLCRCCTCCQGRV